VQHTATHCNTLQLTATHCNLLQHTDVSTYASVPFDAYRVHVEQNGGENSGERKIMQSMRKQKRKSHFDVFWWFSLF